jgi:ATP-dependent DNA ligase
MALPIPRTYEPMNALLVERIPTGPGWQYEPKWDGFRCLAFRDGARIELRSKSGQSLTRYFPEVVAMLGGPGAARFVLDGELVIRHGAGLSFDALLQRVHPAESRVRKLAEQTPALFIVFDLLADEAGRDLTSLPLADRRNALDHFADEHLAGRDGIAVSPATTDLATVRKWFEGVGSAGAVLDGVVAKRLDLSYQSGNRHGMVKVKKMRTADCVVGGFRYAAGSKEIGSLLLGLYTDEGELDHVGFCSAFSAAERRKLRPKVDSLIGGEGFTGAKPGGPSRWSRGRDTTWVPLAPELVVEVRYDHFTNDRFRHGTKFLRWRPDKAPAHCRMRQVVIEAESPLDLLGRRRRGRRRGRARVSCPTRGHGFSERNLNND